jgi:hypothetical protein
MRRITILRSVAYEEWADGFARYVAAPEIICLKGLMKVEKHLNIEVL